MQLGRKVLDDADRDLAARIVAESFGNFSTQLRAFAPQVAETIDGIEVSEAERAAVLAWLGLLRDRRVRGVGLHVASALRSSPTPERGYLRQRVEEAMIPHLREMAQLRDELLPEALPGRSGAGEQWQLSLDRDNVRSIESVSGDFIFDFEPPTTRAVTQEDKYFALFGGAFEQGRALLDLLQLHVRASAPGVPMPAVQRAMTLGAEPMAWPCELSKDRDTSVDFMKAMLCPLKLAASGLDALRAVDSVLSASAAHDAEGARAAHERLVARDGGEQRSVSASKSARGAGDVGKSRMEAIVEQEHSLAQASSWESRAGDARAGEPGVQRPPGGPADADENSCDGSGPCLLRGLLSSDRAQETAARGLMQVAGARLQPADWDMARSVVEAAFSNITVMLERYAPTVADELSQIQLSSEERDSVLKVLELLGDLRVQRLGLQVGEAIRGSGSTQRSELRRRIAEKLGPRHDELDALRAELIPEPLGSYWEERHDWFLTLDEANVRSMRPVDAEARAALETMRAPLSKSLGSDKKWFSMYGGALEQGRALLDILQRCVGSMGPHWTVKLGKTMLFGEATLSWPCEVDDLDSTAVDFSKALLCPLKFGAQGLDALLATADPDAARASDIPSASEEGGEGSSQRERRTLGQLLALPSVQRASANVLLRAGGHHFATSDRGLALKVIQTSFANISQQLQLQAPELASQLEEVELTEDHERGLIRSLRLLTDTRVQVVGIEVTDAIRDCGRPERKYLRHCVEEFLRERGERHPELPNMRELHDKLVTEPLRSSCAAGHHWGVALSAENIEQLLPVDGGASAAAEPEAQLHLYARQMNLEQKYFALFAGALQQARVLLDVMQKCNFAEGSARWSPEQEETGVRFGAAALARPCGLEDLSAKAVDPGRVLLCPLRLGALGLDALTAPLPSAR